MNKWKFIYEEEVYDDWGINYAGILSNGKELIFAHSFPMEKDGPSYMHLYSSIWMEEETEECKFLDTSDNENILLNALDNAGDVDVLGDEGLLHQIEFKDGTEA